MKKMSLKMICLLALTGFAQKAVAQMPNWLMVKPNHDVGIYNMNGSTPALGSTLSMYTSTSGVGGNTAAFDANGNVLFSIYGGQIFSSSNTFVANLPVEKTYVGPYPGTKFISFTNPMTIVPVPQTCDKYYVIYTLTYGPGDLLGAHKLVYCVVDMASGTPAVDPNSLLVYLVNGYDYGYRIPKPINGSNFAISKSLNGQNERYMYVASTGQVKIDRFLISNSGIAFVDNIYQASNDATYPNAQFGFSELELSPDQQHVAFGAYSGSNQLLYQVNLNNYAFSSFEKRALPVTYSYSQLTYGIEYNSSSDKIVISTTAGLLYSKAVANFGTANFDAVTTTNSQFSFTNLELGKSGLIYALATDGTLYSVNTTPSIPTVATTGLSFFNGASYLNEFNFPLPLQIDGENYSVFSGVMAPVVSFNINGNASGNLPPQFIDVYSCTNLSLNNQSYLGYIPPGLLLYGFSCSVQSCDVNGNVVTGSGFLNYASSWRNNSILFNLKSMPTGSVFSPGPPETWLADPAHVGYYKVTVTVKNMCGATATKTAYIRVNASPSPATMSLQMIQGQGQTCYSQNISTICDQTGIYSVGFNLGAAGSTFASNNIANYSRKIEEVDCTSGSVTSLLYQDATPIIPVNPNGPMVGLNLNQAPINGTPGYFASTPSVMGKCYKLSITVTNACSSFTDWTYFKINQFGYWSSSRKFPVEGEAFTLYPNPAKGSVVLKYQGNQQGKAILSVYDVQGRLLINKELPNDYNNLYQENVDITTLSAGAYFYKFNNGKEVISGQLSVQ